MTELHQPAETAAPACAWLHRFLADLAVVRAPNTVRAYRQDLTRWLTYCQGAALDALTARPTDIIAFVRAERERVTRGGTTVGPRTLARRLAALRQWYEYLLLEPEQTGTRRNPVVGGGTLGTAAGMVAGTPGLLSYDRLQPQPLTVAEIDGFIAQLTATSQRDRAIVWLLKDSGLRISEALGLRLPDIHWAGHRLTVRSTKSHTTRIVPLSADALAALSNYLRLERPPQLDHDYVFVCLGRRSFGQPFGYRAWAYICEQARRKAGTPDVHAHAFRHTCATNLAEAGMPLDALQRQLGHRRLETTQLYNQVRDTRLQREYEQALGLHSSPVPDNGPSLAPEKEAVG